MILVTGASGLVGSYLCRELHDKNIPFKGLIREHSNLELLKGVPDSNFIVGDVLDEVSLFIAAEGVKTIVHCAAMISFDPKKKEQMYEVNVEGTRNVVNIALSNSVNKLIHISSVAAIGSNSNETIANESTKWPGTSPSSYYGETKYQAELEVFRGGLEGLEIHCFNPSIILGPGEWGKSSTQLFKYVYNEKKYYTDGLINYVDLRDLSEVIVSAIEKPGTQSRYIVSSGSIAYKDFFKLVSHELNKKAPSVRASKLAVSLTVIFSKLYAYFTGKPPLITRETARNSMKKITYDNSMIKNDFNIEFREISESIKWVSAELLKDSYSLQ